MSTIVKNGQHKCIRPLKKKRGQPATIIPCPAHVIEILQGAFFPEISHSCSTIMIHLDLEITMYITEILKSMMVARQHFLI